MTGPLAQQFARLEESLAFAHSEGLLPDQYEDALATLSVIERHVQDMETEVERVGILATAVGVARLDLANGDAASAKGVLDNAAAKTHEIIRAALLARGYSAEQVDSFLGAALPAREKEEE